MTKAIILPLFFLLITLITIDSQAQTKELADRLFNIHETYREQSLTQRRFKQKDILPLISKRQGNAMYQIEKVGESFEGRTIQMIKIGNGKKKVLLWTQMHGDDPTATMASFDIFNFLEGKNDGFDDLRKKLLDNTTLYFVPMLNPDGAERYQRRTMQGIDMNRDAAARQTPEAQILKGLVDRLKPDYGFNLHDQSPRYSAGRCASQFRRALRTSPRKLPSSVFSSMPSPNFSDRTVHGDFFEKATNSSSERSSGSSGRISSSSPRRASSAVAG